MMRLGEDLVPASGEATTSIPAPDLPPLGCGWATMLSPLVHRVARLVVHRDDEGAVAQQPAHGLDADESALLEVTGQACRRALGVDQGLQGSMEHGEVRAE